MSTATYSSPATASAPPVRHARPELYMDPPLPIAQPASAAVAPLPQARAHAVGAQTSAEAATPAPETTEGAGRNRWFLEASAGFHLGFLHFQVRGGVERSHRTQRVEAPRPRQGVKRTYIPPSRASH